MMGGSRKQQLKIMITVKTYPIPSKKYDELVCTAGVTENGDYHQDGCVAPNGIRKRLEGTLKNEARCTQLLLKGPKL